MEVRLDVLIAGKLNVSRELAKEAVLSGKCTVGGVVVTKPGAKFSDDAQILVEVEKIPFVSRGGFKLAKALSAFNIDLNNLDCLDIGASTGGFTDCMLKNGASRVIALDNGHGQLAQSLIENNCVIVMEGQDIRSTVIDDLPYKPNFFACDLSFISLEKIMHHVAKLIEPKVQGIFLLKPQFECGPGKINKHGVIADKAAHFVAINRVSDAMKAANFAVLGVCESSVTGQNKNTEYLIFVEKFHEKPGGPA